MNKPFFCSVLLCSGFFCSGTYLQLLKHKLIPQITLAPFVQPRESGVTFFKSKFGPLHNKINPFTFNLCSAQIERVPRLLNDSKMMDYIRNAAIDRCELQFAILTLLKLRCSGILYTNRLIHMQKLPSRWRDKCPMCEENVTEDTFHILFECCQLLVLRTHYFIPRVRYCHGSHRIVFMYSQHFYFITFLFGESPEGWRLRANTKHIHFWSTLTHYPDIGDESSDDSLSDNISVPVTPENFCAEHPSLNSSDLDTLYECNDLKQQYDLLFDRFVMFFHRAMHIRETRIHTLQNSFTPNPVL